MDLVPVYEPVLTEDDALAVADAVRSGYVAAGPAVAAFEGAMASLTRMPHAVGVSSGTAALELAVAALGIGPGDEVILPSFTIVSCARAVVEAGATPVLVDVDPGTFSLDVEQVRARVTERTRAVMGVHVYGHPFDVEAVRGAIGGRAVALIEDAAEAHGAEVVAGGAWTPCGGAGDLSVFSFYANKAITTGEGGMVLARDGAKAARVRSLANLAFGEERRYEHAELGHNYRMGNAQAALGLSQAKRIDAIVAAKRRVGSWYRERLSRIAGIELQARAPWARPVDWMAALVLADDAGLDARGLAGALRERGIDTRPFFLGMHEQPALHARGLFDGERHPVSERLARRGLLLPSSPALDEATVERVTRAVAEVVAGRRGRRP
jgi:perosamine synthetase